MSWLKTSPARVVILASCGSATIPWGLTLANFNAMGAATWQRKVGAGGPAVIVTKSQVYLTTESYNWAYADLTEEIAIDTELEVEITGVGSSTDS